MSDIDRLAKLAELKEKGFLTQEEFDAEKRKLLSAPAEPNSPKHNRAGIKESSGISESVRTSFRKVLVLLVLILVGFFFFPMLAEDTGSSCGALEKAVLRDRVSKGDDDGPAPSEFLRLLASGLQRLSNGTLAEQLVAKKYPKLPSAIGCVIAYYDLPTANADSHAPEVVRDEDHDRQNIEQLIRRNEAANPKPAGAPSKAGTGLNANGAFAVNLAVFPENAGHLPRIELSEFIADIVPPRDFDMVGWDYFPDGKIEWLTKEYENYGGTETWREGLVRIQVSQVPTTILRPNKEELAWSFGLITNGSAQSGPQFLRLKPGFYAPPPAEKGLEGVCSGDLFEGCSFTADQALASRRIRSKLLCAGQFNRNPAVYEITADKKPPALLAFFDGGGSAGGSSDIEIHPLTDRESLCSPPS